MSIAKLPSMSFTVANQSLMTQHINLSSAVAAVKGIATKVVAFANVNFMKARFISSIAMHTAWSMTKNFASATSAKTHHFASAVLNSSSIVKTQAAALSHKVSTVAHIYFNRARFISSIAIHSAWSMTKNFATQTTIKAHSVAKVIVRLSSSAGSQVVRISHRVATIAAKCFSKAAHFTALRMAAAKDIAVQGLQVTKLFFSTHQKEVLLTGSGFAIGSVIAAYAAYRIFSAQANKV